MQFTEKEGLLCFPMVVQDRYMGVIVIPLDKMDFSYLKQDLKLLNMFATHAAHALYTDFLKCRQAEKIKEECLNASSTMAHKIIHEVNNPLSIIKNYLKIIVKKLGELDVVDEEIQIVNEEIDSVSHILSSLTAQSENKACNTELMDLNAFLTNFVKIIKDTITENSLITLHLDLDPALPTIDAERYSLQQIIINLVKNAVEAMDNGGNLYITTRYEPNHLKEDFSLENVKQKGYVEVSIVDDGPGMPEEIKDRLFDTFVSTKKSHSGLGLSIVYNLVRSLEGSIVCETEKNKGTRFKIELPTAP
jgi:signal transduction histidine kinase